MTAAEARLISDKNKSRLLKEAAVQRAKDISTLVESLLQSVKRLAENGQYKTIQRIEWGHKQGNPDIADEVVSRLKREGFTASWRSFNEQHSFGDYHFWNEKGVEYTIEW